MRRKLFTLITASMLVLITSVAPLKVSAQGLVEYALVLVLAMVGVGSDEAVEFYVVKEAPPENAMANGNRGTGVFTIIVTVSDDHNQADCQQLIRAPVDLTAELTTVNLAKKGAELMINGETVPLEGACLINANRVVLTLAVDRRRIEDGQEEPPPPDHVGLANLARVFGYSIVNTKNHQTVDSGIREVVPDGFIQTFPSPLL